MNFEKASKARHIVRERGWVFRHRTTTTAIALGLVAGGLVGCRAAPVFGVDNQLDQPVIVSVLYPGSSAQGYRVAARSTVALDELATDGAATVYVQSLVCIVIAKADVATSAPFLVTIHADRTVDFAPGISVDAHATAVKAAPFVIC